MKDNIAYGVTDMIFGDIQIKHANLEEWLLGIPSRTRLAKLVYTEGKTTGHALGILNGERENELYFLKIEEK